MTKVGQVTSNDQLIVVENIFEKPYGNIQWVSNEIEKTKVGQVISNDQLIVVENIFEKPCGNIQGVSNEIEMTMKVTKKV